MNKNLLNTGVQDYIRNFSSPDILAVILQKPIFEGLENKELAQQVIGRRKCKKKLPTWFKTDQIYYPARQAIEQSSSEITARYKAELVSGKSLIDMTGGFGVDSYFFSTKIEQVIYCEREEELSEIAAHNFQIFGANNIKSLHTDGIDFLKNIKQRFDWIYLDPSRRKADQKRVFLLSDAEPSLPEILPLLWRTTRNILIKTSPLLDISSGIDLLGNVREVHVVAVNSEVKELLWILGEGFEEEPKIKTINIRKDREQVFGFKLSEEKETTCNYGPPKKYLYEPNAAILKAGAFRLVAARFGLSKLQEHTHLYTSDELVEFPGRRFEVEAVSDYNRKKISQLNLKRANISARNFPVSVDELRRKFKIRDGGNQTLFFARDYRNKSIVLQCSVIPKA